MPAFSKICFFHIACRPHENAQPAFSNSAGLKSVFVRLGFHEQLTIDGGPNHRNKDVFSNSSGAVCLGLKYSFESNLFRKKILNRKNICCFT